jgi:WD40 repeat protein
VTDEIGCPYKGLAPFEDSDDDVRFFFGRGREREIICANLMASKLTVLYGDTGVGKSSVLRAGVARSLRENGEARCVVVFDNWKDDPARGLAAALAAATEADAEGSLADTLEACSARLAGDVYIILDGFEEYFLYHEGESGPESFFEQFPEAVRRPGLRASFLIALREDALARLDRFKASIPTLFGNYLRLDHLDREAAREAIVRPVERYNELVGPEARVAVEPELVDKVLEQVAAGKVDLGQTGRGVVAEPAGEARIETPYLQLVMLRLWNAEHDAGSRTLRRTTLDDLGGAEEIVRAHLERALDSLTAEQRDVAASVFNHLVTPSGTKIAHADTDLARYADVGVEELRPILAALTSERILRPVAPNGGSPRYEIYHDVLGEAVLAWRTGYETDREVMGERQAAARRHRRLLAALAAGGVLLAVMAGITAFAVAQRSEARTQARQAQARQLTASAVSALGSDPSLSLALAVEAAKLDPGGNVEQVLSTAYLADRQRAVLPAAHRPVTTARFNLDGTRVLAASQDGHARIYGTATHELLHDLDHGAPVNDAAFENAGRFVVTAGQDGSARLWDTVDGELVRSLRHGAPVRTVAIDPSGSRLATGGGRTVSLWLRDATRVAEIRLPKPVTEVALNRDGRRLVVVGNDDVARLYDTSDGRLITSFDQGGTVTSADFSDAARLLVTTGTNETARIWRLRDGKLLHELKGHRGTVLDADFSPGGARIATASADGTGRIWSVRTGALVATLVGHKGIVNSIAFSPDGNFVVTGSDDRSAQVSKADNGQERAWLNGHEDAVRQVAFSADGSSVLTGSDDGTARLWDPRAQPQLEVVSRARGHVLGATHAGRQAIFIAGPGSRARLVRASDGRAIRTFVSRGPVRGVAASADGKTLAFASNRGVTVIRPDGTRIELALPGAAACAVTSDGSRVAGGGAGRVARVWSAEGQVLHELAGHTEPITDVAFSADGERLATASDDNTARIWDALTGEPLRTLMGDRGVTSVAFSPDGRLVLTGGLDHDGRLWNSETGELNQVLNWHFGRVIDANFSPDGRWVVTAGPVTVGLWRPGLRDPVLPYGFGSLNGGLLSSATFDPTGRAVLASSFDGTVRRAECTLCGDLNALLDLARVQLAASGRKLTADERERYGL